MKCRFFLVPHNAPALHGIPDIEMLSVRIACNIIGEPHESRMFDSQMIETTNSPSCRRNEPLQMIKDEVGMYDGKINMPDCFRSSTNKASDKTASGVLTNKFPNEFSEPFYRHKFF